MIGNVNRLWVSVMAIGILLGCSPAAYRGRIDRTAYKIIKKKQKEALGRNEPFTIETPENALRRRLLLDQNLQMSTPASLGVRSLEPIKHWPERKDPVSQKPDDTVKPQAEDQPVTITLIQALQIAAQNSREYQTQKENVFRAALSLDLESDAFRNTFSGVADYTFTHDRSQLDQLGGTVNEGQKTTIVGGVARNFLNGASISTSIGWDLVRMLEPTQSSSRAGFGDASITIPLLRGAGRYIVAEPLLQAERDTIYAIWDFERFKKDFVVSVTDQYLTVLQLEDRVRNQEQNYKGLIASTRRAQRLAEAGKLPQYQVDQAIQNELQSRNQWVSSQESRNRSLDTFKILLGLPTDARIELDRDELTKLETYMKERMKAIFITPPAPEGLPMDAPIVLVPPDPKEAGPFEINEPDAVRLALENRLDLRVQQGRVFDAQRQVVVAADGLRPELTLFGSAQVGQHRTVSSAASPNSHNLDTNRGTYQGILNLDLPLERTREAIAYRDSYITLERGVRSLQLLEDQVKQQVRNTLRSLLEARESLKIQVQAVTVADRRVKGAALQLEAGRAQMRDLLDAQDAQVAAQNALTAALVTYRVAELELQRDLGLLQVDHEGIWHEFDPKEVSRNDAKN